MLSRRVVLEPVCALVMLSSGLAGSAQVTKKPDKKKAQAVQPVASKPDASNTEVFKAQIEAKLLATALKSPDHTNGDYIPCTFTISELFALRQQPALLTLSAAEGEALKEQVLAAVFDGGQGKLVKNEQVFASLISQETFAGLTPSQAFNRILSDLSVVMNTAKDLKAAITTPLSNADSKQPSVEQHELPPLNAEQVAHVKSALLRDATLLGANSEYLSVLSNQIENAHLLDSHPEDLEKAVSAIFAKTDDYFKDHSPTQKEAAANVSTSISQVMNSTADSVLEPDKTQVILDSARNSLSAFSRPIDIGCAMSVLDYSETRHSFGPIVADQYIAVQVVVRNLNAQEEFLLHDVELAVDSSPVGEKGRYFSGRDKMIVRSLANAQSDLSRRNIIVHGIQGVGAVMDAAAIVFGGALTNAAGVFNGAFATSLNQGWRDLTPTQVNLLNDTGFSSSSNSRTVVPKDATAMVVAFIPAKQFEEAWWVQNCAKGLYFQQPPKDADPTGIDLVAPLAACKATAQGTPLKLDPERVKYKNWSPSAQAIFQQLAYAVVAGVHVGDNGNDSSVTQLTCPTDGLGNVDYSKAVGGNLPCTASGEKLEKVASLRLRNAKDQTDPATADAPVSVSGDNTKGEIAFPVETLGGLAAPLYIVYSVDKRGTENKTAASVHVSQQPFLSSLQPNDPEIGSAGGDAKAVSITAKGFHLETIDHVDISTGGGVAQHLPIDPGVKSPTNFAFKLTKANFITNIAAGTTVDYDVTLVQSTGAVIANGQKLTLKNTDKPK
ncbi:MAG: hypothetical protein JWQ49_5267 [Edaphobacter sp.]|nr:hypothetical protein [Edaphobacter sp.]